MPDFVPDGDLPFDAWLRNYAAELNAAPADFGLEAADLAPLNAKKARWDAALTALTPAEKAYGAAVGEKDEARDDVEGVARGLNKKIQANNVPAAKKTAAGVPVYDTTRTPAAVPTTVPVVVKIDTSMRLTHVIHFRDQSTPNSRAKAQLTSLTHCDI